ncbi:DUF3795 domain-containing protein [Chloroflexota bacterium]
MTEQSGLAAACGLYCGDCEYIGTQCSGCGNIKGKPFWTEQFGLGNCPVYSCSVSRQQIEHCGLCPEFPCEMFSSLRDPSLSDEEAEKSVQQRIETLKTRKEIGTQAWLEQKLKSS